MRFLWLDLGMTLIEVTLKELQPRGENLTY